MKKIIFLVSFILLSNGVFLFGYTEEINFNFPLGYTYRQNNYKEGVQKFNLFGFGLQSDSFFNKTNFGMWTYSLINFAPQKEISKNISLEKRLKKLTSLDISADKRIVAFVDIAIGFAYKLPLSEKQVFHFGIAPYVGVGIDGINGIGNGIPLGIILRNIDIGLAFKADYKYNFTKYLFFKTGVIGSMSFFQTQSVQVKTATKDVKGGFETTNGYFGFSLSPYISIGFNFNFSLK